MPAGQLQDRLRFRPRDLANILGEQRWKLICPPAFPDAPPPPPSSLVRETCLLSTPFAPLPYATPPNTFQTHFACARHPPPPFPRTFPPEPPFNALSVPKLPISSLSGTGLIWVVFCPFRACLLLLLLLNPCSCTLDTKEGYKTEMVNTISMTLSLTLGHGAILILPRFADPKTVGMI